MKFKKMTKKLFSLALVAVAAVSVASCNNDKTNDEDTYTYNTYTTLSPSNWNELTYQDANDTQIMSYIGSSFFTYDFKYDAQGNIVSGDYVVEYAAATKLEDVTSQYAGADKGWGIPEGATARAYKITLREDLKWDDGTAIDASDFVYTMKEQLDPLAQHYRADSFYVGSTVIHNAQNYVYQGSDAVVDNADSGSVASKADLVKGSNGVYNVAGANWAKFAVKASSSWCSGYSLAAYANAGYLDADKFAALAALCDADGYVAITDESIALLEDLLDNSPKWGESAAYLPQYIQYEVTYPAMDFSEVGIFVGDTKYELVVILDKALELLKDDGSLDYKAAYNFSSLPLVHKEKWEENKVAPTLGTSLYTSTYCSSVSSTASWGPYTLVSFQSGKEYILERNANWWGYQVYEGQYQTDRIVCTTVENWNTAWLMFLAGEVDAISIDVSVADEYKGSDQAYFTPDDYVASLQLQSSKEGLEARETDGVNKTILTYTDFRKALSLSINRADFAKTCTTASYAGFGLFNSMHYYDVANGGVFRDTIEAKKVLCDVYAVEYDENDEASIEAAYASITGYDLATARALVESAYQAALADGEISATDKVVLTMGTGSITEATQRIHKYLTDTWCTLLEGTSLEGRLEVELKDFSSNWANDFRGGAYDICLGGWSGAAWDPGYFLLAYLSPSYMYSKAWDTSSVTMEFTMKGVGPVDPTTGEATDITDTMSLMAWYNCLNGIEGAKYDFSSNALEESQRLQLIAALEKEVLSVYYTVPLYNYFSASLMSYKTDYVTYEYNTFMGYGGLKYMTYNYTDAEWEEEIADNNGQFNYK